MVKITSLKNKKNVTVTLFPHMKSRMTQSGWSIDRKKGMSHPFYGYDNKGKPLLPDKDWGSPVVPGSKYKTKIKIAKTQDIAGLQGGDVRFDFQLCAVCKDTGKVLSCIKWSFIIINGQAKGNPLPNSEFNPTKSELEESAGA